MTTTYHARGGLIFASCYVYSPMGSSPACERSRLLRALLKAADERFMFKYAVRVRQEVSGCSPLSPGPMTSGRSLRGTLRPPSLRNGSCKLFAGRKELDRVIQLG